MEDDESLKIQNKIWGKASNFIQKVFDNEPSYNKKYLKTKIKTYENIIYTSFHDNGMPEKNVHCVCLSVILTDSGF